MLERISSYCSVPDHERRSVCTFAYIYNKQAITAGSTERVNCVDAEGLWRNDTNVYIFISDIMEHTVNPLYLASIIFSVFMP